mgnify:CR=1 FL=1|jgi:hypothetical protein
MLNSTPNEPDPRDVDRIVHEGPSGAVALAGIATVIVVAIWFAFYFFVFSPRALP